MGSNTTINYSLNHQHLVVDDVPGTVAFYESSLGATKLEEMEFRGSPIVRLKLGDLPLTVSQPIHEGIGNHIGLTVDDFDAAIDELRGKGVEFVVEPQDMGVAKFAFIKDCTGALLEIVHYSNQN